MKHWSGVAIIGIVYAVASTMIAAEGVVVLEPTSAARYFATAERIKAQLYETPQARVRVLAVDGPPIDLMLHHGGAYSARERARLEGRVRDGAVLLFLDSHADLMDQVGLAPRPRTVAEADRIEYDIASHVVPSLPTGSSARSFILGTAAWIDSAGCRRTCPECARLGSFASGIGRASTQPSCSTATARDR